MQRRASDYSRNSSSVDYCRDCSLFTYHVKTKENVRREIEPCVEEYKILYLNMGKSFIYWDKNIKGCLSQLLSLSTIIRRKALRINHAVVFVTFVLCKTGLI